MTDILLERPASLTSRKPRIGFLGVGWIGRHRMEAMLATGAVEAAVVADPSGETREQAARLAPGAASVESFEALLDQDLGGVVIATPSAMHAEQVRRALDRGLAVFCQKPLGRTEAEVRALVEAARRADRLLSVDLSYRFTEAAQALRSLVQQGALGGVHAVDLTFHNAWGPDKPWFYDPALSGGGCVMDLGVHLVDLALWLLEGAEVDQVSSDLFAQGVRIDRADVCEDYGLATLRLNTGAVVRLACSWNLPAGQEAVIAATLYGSKGGAEMRNVGGSFYDFVAERFEGTTRHELAAPPDAWGGRAAADWARRLAAGERFDPGVERLIPVARVLDRIYGR
ncbi:MAG TPA: Gfo/Idh/MocA family oxidoreductase [Brevundimonas sp.]|uniref:Gfo/Idh/MocA family protein n=1 Tax=Brevundimonas sp. TaxID=1871086 RepID=UPI002EDAA9A9